MRKKWHGLFYLCRTHDDIEVTGKCPSGIIVDEKKGTWTYDQWVSPLWPELAAKFTPKIFRIGEDSNLFHERAPGGVVGVFRAGDARHMRNMLECQKNQIRYVGNGTTFVSTTVAELYVRFLRFQRERTMIALEHKRKDLLQIEPFFWDIDRSPKNAERREILRLHKWYGRMLKIAQYYIPDPKGPGRTWSKVLSPEWWRRYGFPDPGKLPIID